MTMHLTIHLSPADVRKSIFDMTQRELAAMLGVSQRTVARWESGRAPKSALKMLAIYAGHKGAALTTTGSGFVIDVSQSATAPAQAGAGAPGLPVGSPPPETPGCPT